ncbi:MAG TPA: hypothetical protein VLA76_07330 [Candidatus Angelobacter sp.]|nr:hypothetical protein [Candidatus Angelobacter sp.]
MTISTERTLAVTGTPDRSIAAATDEAIIVWRGEQLAFRSMPARIALADDRGERDRMLASYLEAVEALNPRYTERLARRAGEAGDVFGIEPATLAADLERFVLHAETPYYAALRRYLALVDIEQGDATIADLWHISRGGTWAHWFGEREVREAVRAVTDATADASDRDGWQAAEALLRGADGSSQIGAAAVHAARATLVGSPTWVTEELGLGAGDLVPYVDFVAFVRLWRLREAIGELHYELRLAGDGSGDGDPALARAYFSGIVGHMTGVSVPEELYLVALGEGTPFASARELVVEILAADLVDTLEARHGESWWRDPEARRLTEAVAASASVADALAPLGYDALDWRPVLRQIRTRLIGEMSGYGGPNITTRAGTRKV